MISATLPLLPFCRGRLGDRHRHRFTAAEHTTTTIIERTASRTRKDVSAWGWRARRRRMPLRASHERAFLPAFFSGLRSNEKDGVATRGAGARRRRMPLRASHERAFLPAFFSGVRSNEPCYRAQPDFERSVQRVNCFPSSQAPILAPKTELWRARVPLFGTHPSPTT